MSDALPPHGTGSADKSPAYTWRTLADADAGRVEVRTVTGSYLLDLTNRWLIRAPVTVSSDNCALTWTFDINGTRLPIVELTDCVIGRPMRATVRIRDADQPLRTSPVQAVAVAGEDRAQADLTRADQTGADSRGADP